MTVYFKGWRRCQYRCLLCRLRYRYRRIGRVEVSYRSFPKTVTQEKESRQLWWT